MAQNNVKRVDFSGGRHRRNSKDLFSKTCDMLTEMKGPMSGYIVMIWDDSGQTYCSTKSGGPISLDCMPVHAFSILTSMLSDGNHT